MRLQEWDQTRIKYIADCNARVLPEDTHPEQGFKYVDISNVGRGFMDLFNSPLLTFADAPSRARRIAGTGSTVVSTVRTYLRAVASVPESDDPLVFSTGLAVLEPRSGTHPRFLTYCVQSDDFIDRVVASSKGVSYPAIAPAELVSFPVRFPSLPQQAAIADFLDRETAQIDTLIEKQEQLIASLRERRASTINTLLVPGSGMTPLKRLATIQSGLTLSGEGDADDPEWPYLRVANVQVGYLDLSTITTVRVPLAVAESTRLQTGDVLVTEGGDIDKLGRGALWHGEVSPILHQNHVFAVRPGSRLLPEYLVYWLDAATARTYFRTTALKTTNLASTNKWTLGNLPVACPSRKEQQVLVAELDQRTNRIDSLISKAERFIELARERRAALITAAVTGQIDVTTASA